MLMLSCSYCINVVRVFASFLLPHYSSHPLPIKKPKHYPTKLKHYQSDKGCQSGWSILRRRATLRVAQLEVYTNMSRKENCSQSWKENKKIQPTRRKFLTTTFSCFYKSTMMDFSACQASYFPSNSYTGRHALTKGVVTGGRAQPLKPLHWGEPIQKWRTLCFTSPHQLLHIICFQSNSYPCGSQFCSHTASNPSSSGCLRQATHPSGYGSGKSGSLAGYDHR